VLYNIVRLLDAVLKGDAARLLSDEAVCKAYQATIALGHVDSGRGGATSATSSPTTAARWPAT